jgi:hypothetical protein
MSCILLDTWISWHALIKTLSSQKRKEEEKEEEEYS